MARKKLGGTKHDQGKSRVDLIPPAFILAIGNVLAAGAAKYGDRNWEMGMTWSRPYSAAMRHMLKWWAGESIDQESGMSHLWHAATEIAFLAHYESTGTGLDDRPQPGLSEKSKPQKTFKSLAFDRG